MWERREVKAIRPQSWAAVAGVAAALPLLGLVWWWGRPVLSPDTIARIIAVWFGYTAIRWLLAYWYNATSKWHGGISFLLAGPELMAVSTARAFLVALWMTPGAWLLGVVWQVSALFPPPPAGWPLFIAVELPIAQVLLTGGSAWLYTRVVASISLALSWEDQEQPQGWTLVASVVPERMRSVVGTLVFSWVALGSLGAIGVLMTGLAILAKRVPAGYFGLGVALFVGFVLAVLGLIVAFILGWWAAIVTRGYNRWVARGGGVVYQLHRHMLSVS